MKIIYADKLMETIRKHSYLMLSEDWDERAYAMTVTGIEQAIDEQPEAVIRCKYCIHRPKGDAYDHDLEFPEYDYKCPCRCEDNWYSWMPDDDWYCANGERREDE